MSESPVEVIENKSSLSEKAAEIYKKYDLEATLNRVQIIEHTQQFVEKYQVPESFWADETNLSLLLGCSEKMIGNADPIYKGRIERFSLWLVEPSVPKGLIDVDGIWGTEPSRAELPKEEAEKYVAERTNPTATDDFIQKHQPQMERCKQVWKTKKGIDLKFKVSIVEDDVGNFRTKLRSAGFIRTPDEDAKPGGESEIEMVLLKGYSAERDDMVNHELYHVEDVGNFIRRGREGHILESLDELHTEHAVGNYTQNHEDGPSGSSYFTLKELWNRISFVGDIDFNLLSDRKAVVEAITSEFGLSGLVDFSLMFSHGDARFSIFDTFYGDYETVLMSTLVQKEKVAFQKEAHNRTVSPNLEDLHKQIGLLALRITPPETYYSKSYRNMYEMFPSADGPIFGYMPNPEEPRLDFGHLDVTETKQMYTSYAQAIALAEVYYHNPNIMSQAEYRGLLDSLSQIPFNRKSIDFHLPTYIENETKKNIDYGDTPEEAKKEAFRHLFYDLLSEMSPSDISIQLENNQTRQLISRPFLNEIVVMASNVLGYNSEEFKTAFIRGFYSFRCNSDLRELALREVQDKFPQYAPTIEKFKQQFDVRKVANMSF